MVCLEYILLRQGCQKLIWKTMKYDLKFKIQGTYIIFHNS